jgi:hypothetical protein
VSMSKSMASGLPSAIYEPFDRISSWRANAEAAVFIVCVVVLVCALGWFVGGLLVVALPS